jgi:hypothetical protein
MSMDWYKIKLGDYLRVPLIYPKRSQKSMHDSQLMSDKILVGSDKIQLNTTKIYKTSKSLQQPYQFNYITLSITLSDSNPYMILTKNELGNDCDKIFSLHKQLIMIPITDLRKIIIDYLLLDKIHININGIYVCYEPGDVYYYPVYNITITHNNIIYKFQHSIFTSLVQLHINNLNNNIQISVLYQHLFRTIKKNIPSEINPIYDILIIYDNILEQLREHNNVL